jgi:hypothetical protein
MGHRGHPADKPVLPRIIDTAGADTGGAAVVQCATDRVGQARRGACRGSRRQAVDRHRHMGFVVSRPAPNAMSPHWGCLCLVDVGVKHYALRTSSLLRAPFAHADGPPPPVARGLALTGIPAYRNALNKNVASRETGFFPGRRRGASRCRRQCGARAGWSELVAMQPPPGNGCDCIAPLASFRSRRLRDPVGASQRARARRGDSFAGATGSARPIAANSRLWVKGTDATEEAPSPGRRRDADPSTALPRSRRRWMMVGDVRLGGVRIGESGGPARARFHDRRPGWRLS